MAEKNNSAATIGFENELWQAADALRLIAQELVQAVRNNVTIDRALRENVRAKMRVMIKRILRRHG